MRQAFSDPERAERLAEVAKAIAHPMRLSLVAILCDGDERVGDLALRLDARQAAISQQLRILRMSGLVAVQREGGVARYTLAEPRLRDLVDCLNGCGNGAGGGRTADSSALGGEPK
jgi:ArsR family transcriptional regulator